MERFGALEPYTHMRRRSVLTEDIQLDIILYFMEFPEKSLNEAVLDLGICHSTIHKALKLNKFKDYKFTPVQALYDADYAARMEYCAITLDRHFSENFFKKVLWTDEATFTTAGFFNRKNSHTWSVDNPRKVKPVGRQGRRSVNVWCGIYRNRIVGPVFYQSNMNADRFIEITQNHILPLVVDLPDRDQMIYQMDGAPYHRRNDVNAPVGKFLRNYCFA